MFGGMTAVTGKPSFLDCSMVRSISEYRRRYASKGHSVWVSSGVGTTSGRPYIQTDPHMIRWPTPAARQSEYTR